MSIKSIELPDGSVHSIIPTVYRPIELEWPINETGMWCYNLLNAKGLYDIRMRLNTEIPRGENIGASIVALLFDTQTLHETHRLYPIDATDPPNSIIPVGHISKYSQGYDTIGLSGYLSLNTMSDVIIVFVLDMGSSNKVGGGIWLHDNYFNQIVSGNESIVSIRKIGDF